MQASSRRRFESRNQIIDLESLDEYDKENQEIHYPFALEREIIQALRTAQKDEAKQLIQTFLEELIERGAKMIDIHQERSSCLAVSCMLFDLQVWMQTVCSNRPICTNNSCKSETRKK